MKALLQNAMRWTALAAVAGGLVAGSPTAASADEAAYPEQCLTGRAICIDMTTRTVDWVVDGEVLTRLDARFGAKGTPTRKGLFKVYRKSERHVSRAYGASMPYSLFFDGGQAVHHSPDFARRGYNGASRGCVNTRDLNAMAWLFKAVKIGDKVYVYASPSTPGKPKPSSSDYTPVDDPWRW